MLNKNLSRKILFIYLILIVLSLAVMAVITVKVFNQDYTQEINKQLNGQALLFRSILKDTPLNTESLEPKIREYGKSLHSRITIINKDGSILADSETDPQRMENHNNRPEIISARQNGLGTNIRYSHTLSIDMLYLAIPFEKEKLEGLVIRMALPLSQVKHTISHVYQAVGVIFLLLTIIALFLGLWLTKMITQPIKKIVSASESIAKGDFSKKLDISSQDEIGTLAAAINSMSNELQHQFAEINEKSNILNTVLSSMSDGIITIDGNLKIKYANIAVGKLLNFDIIKSINKYLWEMARNDRFIGFVKDFLANPSESSKYADITSAASKQLRAYCTQIEALPDHFMIVIYDMTEQMKFEQLRKDFVANVSHELRTPLTFIKGYVETLKEGDIEDKTQQKEFLDIINKNVSQLTNLVEDLLDLSRLESKAGIAKIRPTDLSKLIEKVVDSFSPAILKKRHNVIKEIQKDYYMINADPDLLEKAIANLIDNAIKYTPEKGRIEITAQKIPEGVKIEVSDTGIGIPEEDIPRIFERFYRVDKSRSREMGGTGLGLAIVKHIIQLHNGSVSVISEVGKGTTFSLILP